MKIWRMCIACCKPKATNTHSEYEIGIAFPLQQWLQECDSALHHKYIACLVIQYKSAYSLMRNYCNGRFCVLLFQPFET